MEKQFSKNLENENVTSVNEAQQTNESGRTFSSVEEMLQFDREQNPVPSSVSERLNNSIRSEPVEPSAGGWWKRLLGKKS